MTTAEEYYEAIKNVGPGKLFYLTKRNNEEFVFEFVVVDTTKKTETVNRLKRVMLDENFIAFPGTPEMMEFMQQDVANSENNQ